VLRRSRKTSAKGNLYSATLTILFHTFPSSTIKPVTRVTGNFSLVQNPPFQSVLTNYFSQKVNHEKVLPKLLMLIRTVSVCLQHNLTKGSFPRVLFASVVPSVMRENTDGSIFHSAIAPPPKGPSTLAFFASVSPSVMASLPNCSLCFSRAITYVIAQRKQLGSGAIADGETDAKNASVGGP
jgi:hypothetical protein